MNSNGILLNTYNDIVASSEGVEDAQAVEGERRGGNPDKWTQQGRVALFFIDGLTLPGGGKREPRYFNQVDLMREWNRQNPDNQEPLPAIQVVEMVDLYKKALAN